MTKAQQELDPSFQQLLLAMKRRPRPLALLGAGVSVGSGYPTWNQLLASLEEAAKGKMSPRLHSYLSGLQDPTWRAEELQRVLGESEFRRILVSTFARPTQPTSRLLELIARLGFRHLLTTNYDDAMERGFAAASEPLETANWTRPEEVRRFLAELYRDDGARYLVHLHGRFDDPASLVLTESSYAERYARSDDTRLKLLSILITQPVVFIGFSVTDPDLTQLMREVNARLGRGTPLHFALIGYHLEGDKELVERRFVEKFGILPVFYPIQRHADGGEDHSGLIDLLTRLQKELEIPRAQVAASRGARALDEEADFALERSPRGRRGTGRSRLGFEDPDDWMPAPPSGPPEPRSLRIEDYPHPGQSEPLIALDPLDQQKGRWGGLAERNGRRLKVENVEERGEWCAFDLVVESFAKTRPLGGEVILHLHQTFARDKISVRVEDGEARLSTSAYGAFTVGAEADGGATRLELDLAEIPAFPTWFRQR